MNLVDITPLLLTCNEAPNLDRTLAPLSWAARIVVVDSGSTDGTLDLLNRDRRIHVVHRVFDTHARQWNFALQETGITTPWVLALDADYRLSDELVSELRQLEPPAAVAGYRARFVYMINGRPLRGSLYPPKVALFKRSKAEYVQDGHTQRLRLDGEIGKLQAPIYHDDRKPYGHWRKAQHRYMALEASKLRTAPLSTLSWADRARRVFLGPFLVVPYCLLIRGLILDGSAGLTYTWLRFYAEATLARALWRHSP